MRVRQGSWISAQMAAAMLDTTSDEVCRLLNIGRLKGTKQRLGNARKTRWRVDPQSIAKEKRYRAKRAALLRSRARTGAKA